MDIPAALEADSVFDQKATWTGLAVVSWSSSASVQTGPVSLSIAHIAIDTSGAPNAESKRWMHQPMVAKDGMSVALVTGVSGWVQRRETYEVPDTSERAGIYAWSV